MNESKEKKKILEGSEGTLCLAVAEVDDTEQSQE